MYAIYAFCRLVDDVADEPAPMEAKRAGLGAWRERGRRRLCRAGEDAVTRVLVAAVRRFGLRQQDFQAVIDGMQMDAETVIAAPDFATLDLYCDRVAAAVGRLSVRAFGDSSAQADAVAFSLGRALQLTNILRDLAEDAARGRLYLPRSGWTRRACRTTRRRRWHPTACRSCASACWPRRGAGSSWRMRRWRGATGGRCGPRG